MANEVRIDDAELLGLDHDYQFWGDVFNYRNVQTLTVRGRISTPDIQRPVSGIYSGVEALLDEFDTDYGLLYVNDQYLGKGRLTDASFESGLDGRDKKYSISLELYHTGNLFNLTGSHYEGVDMRDGIESASKHIEDLNESFSFSDEDNGAFSFSRSLTLSLRDSDPQVAKDLADEFFFNDPSIALLNATYPGFYSGVGHKQVNESYDLVNNTFSFDETFRSKASEDVTGWYYTHSVQLDRNRASVRENGRVESFYSNDLPGSAMSGYNQAKVGVYKRCTGALEHYLGEFGFGHLNSCVDKLPDNPVGRSVLRDDCRGVVTYDYQYEYDPAIRGASTYTWEYSTRVSRGLKNIYDVSEDGKICWVVETGSQSSKIANAVAAFDEAKVLARMNAAYGASFINKRLCKQSGILYKKQVTKEYSDSDGCFGYSFDYTDDPKYKSGAFGQVDLKKTDRAPIHIANSFNVANHKEIIQPGGQSTLSRCEYNISVVGNGAQTLTGLLSKAASHATKPSGNVVFMTDADYTWNPGGNSLQLRVGFAHDGDGPRAFSDTLIW